MTCDFLKHIFLSDNLQSHVSRKSRILFSNGLRIWKLQKAKCNCIFILTDGKFSNEYTIRQKFKATVVVKAKLNQHKHTILELNRV